jgi:hypothetical protein
VSTSQWLARWTLILAAAAFLALSWITIALAQADTDSDAFDGDEAAMPIFLGVAVLGIVLVLALRRSPKPPR